MVVSSGARWFPGRQGSGQVSGPGAQALEGRGDERVGEVVGGQAAVRAVPLGERVDGAEQQPAGDRGVDVGTDVALLLGGAHEVGDDPVELAAARQRRLRSEEHTSELQSRQYLVCRLLLEKKKNKHISEK